MLMEGWMGAGGASIGLPEDILGGESDFRWRVMGSGADELGTANRGLAEEPWRRWTVEVLEVGEAACEASDSTSSRELSCQPLLTLTIAYERRVRNSAESSPR